ncbi:MAG: IPT/TIG domain-containing protein [Candidatus Nanopelagicales bacterium]
MRGLRPVGPQSTISGTGFVTGALVEFGDTEATDVTVVSATEIQATTPPGAVGDVDVIVTNPDGTAATLPDGYQYLPPDPPTIASVLPTSGPSAGGNQVTITGSGFTAATTARFGGSAATVSEWSATALTVTAPAGSPGAVNVSVTDVGGTATLTSAYTYTGPPAITGVQPASGDDQGGTSITVTGSGFTASGASVTVGGAAATSVTVVSSTRITAVTPAGTPGSSNVTVTNQWGSATLTNGFTYVSTPPTISDVSPGSGPATGGTEYHHHGNRIRRWRDRTGGRA